MVKQGGINGRYYNNLWMQGNASALTIDSQLNFNWGSGLVSGEAADMVSANWDGYLSIPVDGYYTFYLTFDNSAKFWLDEVLEIML